MYREVVKMPRVPGIQDAERLRTTESTEGYHAALCSVDLGVRWIAAGMVHPLCPAEQSLMKGWRIPVPDRKSVV